LAHNLSTFEVWHFELQRYLSLIKQYLWINTTTGTGSDTTSGYLTLLLWYQAFDLQAYILYNLDLYHCRTSSYSYHSPNPTTYKGTGSTTASSSTFAFIPTLLWHQYPLSYHLTGIYPNSIHFGIPLQQR
jgi:hypothetical protein